LSSNNNETKTHSNNLRTSGFPLAFAKNFAIEIDQTASLANHCSGRSGCSNTSTQTTTIHLPHPEPGAKVQVHHATSQDNQCSGCTAIDSSLQQPSQP
jgi:hypothetical protein